MRSPQRASLLISLLAVLAIAPDSPGGLFCACGVQVGGTVATSDRGVIVISFAGTPQAGKFDGTTITARTWGRTVFGHRLARNDAPGRGLPVVVTLDVTRNGDGTYGLTRNPDGSYRINEIWANVR